MKSEALTNEDTTAAKTIRKIIKDVFANIPEKSNNIGISACMAILHMHGIIFIQHIAMYMVMVHSIFVINTQQISCDIHNSMFRRKKNVN